MTGDDDCVVAIDPGLRCCGVAIFEHRELVDCYAVDCYLGDGPFQWRSMARKVTRELEISLGGLDRIDVLAIEHMKTRRGREDVHADLIQLSEVSGGIWAADGLKPREWRAVDPAAWTHKRSKAVNHPLIRRELEPHELKVLKAGLAGVLRKDNLKEVLDAVGIGLWITERF